MIETLEHAYSSESTQRELSIVYRHYRVQMVFKIFFCTGLVLWTKEALALEGLIDILTQISARFEERLLFIILKNLTYSHS